MMDQFREEVVTKRNPGMQTALYVAASAVMVLLGVYAFLSFASITRVVSEYGFTAPFFVTLAEILVFGGAAVMIFLFRDRLKAEYEYTLTNTQMDFAMVFNNKKRKSLGTMNIRNVEACGLVASGSFNRYISMQNVKRTNWFLNRDAELFYFFFQKDGQKRIIIIEPSAEMRDMIKKVIPQGVWQNN